MPAERRVLVVGTTADYIDWIRHASPGRALFLTDPDIRRRAGEERPAPAEEILCDPSSPPAAVAALKAHLREHRIRLSGVACFDCESMALAALIAAEYGLPYPPIEAVRLCRDKYLTKVRWQEHGIPCPRTERIVSASGAADFARRAGGPVVMKPATGSGSELVFFCSGPEACRSAFLEIERGLAARRDSRLYADGNGAAPCIVAEAYIDGEEYSCDAVVAPDRLIILRLTRKIRSPRDPFGTIRGYALTPALPGGIRMEDFRERLRRAAAALGITRGILMTDLILRQEDAVFLEMTPRAGGDCLPALMRESSGIDMLKLSLDLAENPFLDPGPPSPERPYVGLRLFAGAPGVVAEIDAAALAADPRVRRVQIIRRPADLIRMPPEDYDAWLLGHVIFAPSDAAPLSVQCDELAGRLTLRMAPC